MTSNETGTRGANPGFAIVTGIALALVAAGAAFRLEGLLRSPLWLDEAYSAYAVAHGFDFLWSVVPRYDTHPPLYYSLLWLWSLVFGDSLAGLRSLGLASGVATLLVSAWAGRELGRAVGVPAWPVAAMAAGLAAVSPLLIDMSRETRPYPLMVLAYALALASILRLGRTAAETGAIERAPLAAYLIGLCLTLWLHNVGPLFGTALVAALVAVLSATRPGAFDRRLLLGGHALAAVLYLPGLLILLDQAPTWVKSTWLVFRWQGLHWKLAALLGAPGIVAVSAAATLAILGVATMVRLGRTRTAIALGLAAFVPAAASIAISVSVAPVFLVRTLTPIGIPALLVVALGATSQSGRRRWLAAAAATVLVAQLVVFDLGARRRGPREDWYGAVRWIEQRYQPGDVVYAYPNEGALPFDRALRDLGLEMPTRPIPSAVPAFDREGWHPTGSRGVVSLPPERLRAIAEDPRTMRTPTIWLLRLGPWDHDKGDVFLQELSRGRTTTGRWQKGAIDIVGLRRADDPITQPPPDASH